MQSCLSISPGSIPRSLTSEVGPSSRSEAAARHSSRAYGGACIQRGSTQAYHSEEFPKVKSLDILMPLRLLVRAHRARQQKLLEEQRTQKILAEDAAGFRTHPHFDLLVAIDHNIIAASILGKISRGVYELT